jgi:predicted TPR repeat methyltransferase
MAKAGARPSVRSAAPTAPVGGQSAGVAAAPAVEWVTLGQYYEAQSDASSAAYAYRQALRDRADPAIAFAAGRTSEASGDILSAVECYAQTLEAKRGPKDAG